MSVAILVPSLNRPHRILSLLANIHDVTQADHRILFCVSDPESSAILANGAYIDDSAADDHRYVTRMNKLARLVDEDYIFFGSDDVLFHPNWFEAAVEAMGDTYALATVNDLHQPVGTAALIKTSYLDRAVFDSPGDAFHSGYIHNFADNEQFLTAAFHGLHVHAIDSIVEHLHPAWDRSIPWDSTYLNAQSGWDHDAALFHERMARLNAS